MGVIVNPSRVYGPGDNTYSNAITRMLKRFMQGKPILVPGCMEVIANYSFIDDIVEGHLLAMKKGAGRASVISSGGRTSVTAN